MVGAGSARGRSPLLSRNGYAYAYEADRSRSTRLSIRKALALCSAGHSDEKLDQLGGLSGNPPEVRARLLRRAWEL